MKKTIKRMALLMVGICAFVCLTACDDDWEPLKWSYENDNPESVTVTEDLSQLTVIANENGGKIILTCENYDDLFLKHNNEILKNGFENDEVKITAQGNKIIIDFVKFETLPQPGECVILDAYTRNNKHPRMLIMTYRKPGSNNE